MRTLAAGSRPGGYAPNRMVLLGWVGAAIVLGWAAARIGLGYPRPSFRPVQLHRREIAFIAAAADSMFPRGGAIAPSGGDAQVPAYVDRLVAASHPRTRVLMRLLFFLMEHATLCFPAPGGLSGLRRFSALSPGQCSAALESWGTSRLFPRRLVFLSLRALLTLGYFAHPPVLRALELAPYAIASPVVEADLLYPPIGALPSDIRLTRADLTRRRDTQPIDLSGPLMPDYAEEAP